MRIGGEKMESKNRTMPERKKPLYITVYDQLFKLITNGVYFPNSQLPSEPELAKMFGVSRMTLRQALSLLEDDGLIRRIHGKGNFIMENSTDTPETGLEKIGNPIYKAFTKQIEDVQMKFRIDLDSEYTRQVLNRKSAAVVAVERWYKSEEVIVAYAFTFMSIEAVTELNLDLQDKPKLLEMLETGIYELATRSTIEVKRLSSVNSPFQELTVTDGDECDLLLESVYVHDHFPLVYNKFYIPKDLSLLKINAVK